MILVLLTCYYCGGYSKPGRSEYFHVLRQANSASAKDLITSDLHMKITKPSTIH